MKKIIIPPVLLILCVLLMMSLHFFLPIETVIPDPLNLAGLVFLSPGLALPIWTRAMFARQGTEIHTFRSPQKLVTTGPFRYSRNPIYLGFTFILIGTSILLGSVSPVVVVVIFVTITDQWYIPYEEKRMGAIFGAQYLAYEGQG